MKDVRTTWVARAFLATLLLLGSCDGGRFASLEIRVAAPVGGPCNQNLGDEVFCTTIRLFRDDGGTLTSIPLLRTDDDHAMAPGAVELRFDRDTIAFDARLEEGVQHDLVIVVYGGSPFTPRFGARIENVDLSKTRLNVRLYPFDQWACAGEAENASEAVVERAFHQAVRVGNGDVVLLGGITGTNIGPASAAIPPAGTFVQPEVEVYDAREHTFRRLTATDPDGNTGFRRFLFGAYYAGPDGDQRFRIRVVGGYELTADQQSSEALAFDNSGNFVGAGAPFKPGTDAVVAPMRDLVYDAQARTITIGPEIPAPLQGAAVTISDPAMSGARAVLIGLALVGEGYLPPTQYFTLGGDGTPSVGLDLGHPRLGATVTPLPMVDDAFLVWGGDVATMTPLVLENAGEIIGGSGTLSTLTAVGGVLPQPVAFHTATPVSEQTVVIAGGWVVETSGLVRTMVPTNPLYAFNAMEGPTPMVALEEIADGDYTPTSLHTATNAPGRGVVLVGGASVAGGSRLVPVRNVGLIAGAAGARAYDGAIGDLGEARFGHQATLLDGDRLLVTGGLGVAETVGFLRALAAPEILYLGVPRTREIPAGTCFDVPNDPPADAGPPPGDSGPPPMDAGTVDAGPPVDSGV